MAKGERGRNKAAGRAMERMATDFGAFYPLGYVVAAFRKSFTASRSPIWNDASVMP